MEGVPTELIFNLDEVGMQKWADRKKKKILAPVDMKNSRIEYAVERTEKRITIVSAISMAGDCLTPMIITHRKTIDKELLNSGIRIGEDILLETQESSFINFNYFY